MPTATVTVRELKNKDTGIDLSVPTYKETHGTLLGYTVEYHVVVVSSLPFFKSPKHKETDRVQFMISKKFSDFEELHERLNGKFSGTMFPPLPRRVLRVTEVVCHERRSSLDHFLKLIAAVPKIASSTVMLEFLGVNAITAGKYRRDASTSDNTKQDEDKEDKKEDEKTNEATSPNLNLFDDDEDEEDNSTGLFLEGGNNSTSDLFIGDPSNSKHSETALFEEQDYGGGITEEDEKNLFLPDSIITKKVMISTDDSDETSDLFDIEDNLDDLMNINITKSKKPEVTSTKLPANQEQSSKNPPANQDSDSKDLPANQNAASTPQKPQLPQKPKPAPRSKPTDVTTITAGEKPKPATRQKPPVSKKPPVSEKPPVSKKPVLSEKVEDEEQSTMESLNTDDILKYIESNAQDNDTDLDLFS